MKTTLNKIIEHSPCKGGWEKLLNALRKTKADDEELALLTILDSNGIEDATWCFRAVDGHDTEISAFSRFCAMQNIEKIKPYTSEDTYNLIIEWLKIGNEDIRSSAWEAARSAARSAAWSAADSAAWSAARSSVWALAWEAARSAARSAALASAWSAADSAAWASAYSSARSSQEIELRRILGQLNENKN